MVVNHVQWDINAIPLIISKERNEISHLKNIKTKPARPRVRFVPQERSHPHRVNNVQQVKKQPVVAHVSIALLGTVYIKTKWVRQNAKIVQEK